VINEGSAFYGALLEFGTRHIASRPWMTPTFDTSAPAAVQKVGERLGKGVEKLTNELAGKFKSIRKATLRRL
jgi:hypothetical protein